MRERQLARSNDLFAQNFISQGAVDTNQTLVDSQQAVVAADRAAIEAAQVGLSYNRIVAPAAGRAGAINVFAGSLVQPTGAPLVTITQLDPIAVGFSLPQRNLGDALQTLRSGGGKVFARSCPRRRGTLSASSSSSTTRSTPARGRCASRPSSRTRTSSSGPARSSTCASRCRRSKDAVVMPQAAIIQAPRGKIVYVVDARQQGGARGRSRSSIAFGEEAAVTGVQAGRAHRRRRPPEPAPGRDA